MKEQILALAIQQLPSIVEALKALFRKNHPDEPQPTSEQVIAGFQAAGVASLTKDGDWLAAHPDV